MRYRVTVQWESENAGENVYEVEAESEEQAEATYLEGELISNCLIKEDMQEIIWEVEEI